MYRKQIKEKETTHTREKMKSDLAALPESKRK